MLFCVDVELKWNVSKPLFFAKKKKRNKTLKLWKESDSNFDCLDIELLTFHNFNILFSGLYAENMIFIQILHFLVKKLLIALRVLSLVYCCVIFKCYWNIQQKFGSCVFVSSFSSSFFYFFILKRCHFWQMR